MPKTFNNAKAEFRIPASLCLLKYMIYPWAALQDTQVKAYNDT